MVNIYLKKRKVETEREIIIDQHSDMEKVAISSCSFFFSKKEEDGEGYCYCMVHFCLT